MGAPRQEFTDRQKTAVYKASAADVGRRWEHLRSPAHYQCASCLYVSPAEKEFEVDHVYPTSLGGGNDRHAEDVVAAIGTEGELPDPDLFLKVGVQAQLLCWECYRTKGNRLFAPADRGYAYSRPEFDRNPDAPYREPTPRKKLRRR